MKDLILHGSEKSRVVTVKDDLTVSNLLQLKEIEKYAQETGLSMNEAAYEWIAKNSADWRSNHTKEINRG
jgi:hypothetical protein